MEQSWPLEFAPAPRYAVQLRITPQLKAALHKASASGDKVSLRFGPGQSSSSNAITVGSQEYTFTANEEGTSDVVRLPPPGSSHAAVEIGQIHQKLHVQRVLDASERERARARGAEAERRLKHRTLQRIEDAPHLAGNEHKKTVKKVVRKATPPPASLLHAQHGPLGTNRQLTPPPSGRPSRSVTPPPVRATAAPNMLTTGPPARATPPPGPASRATPPPGPGGVARTTKGKAGPSKLGKGGAGGKGTASTVPRLAASPAALQGARDSLRHCLVGILGERPYKLRGIEGVLADVAATMPSFRAPAKDELTRVLRSVAEFKAPGQYVLFPELQPEAADLARCSTLGPVTSNPQGESPSAAQPSTPPSSQETQDAPMVEEPIAKPILARSRKAANSRKASPAPPLYQPSTDHARASMARASPDVHMVDAATARQPGAQQGVAAQRHGVQKEKGERLIKKQKRSSAVGQLAAQPATPSSSDGGDCAAAADAAGRAPHGVSSEAGPLSSGADDLHATHDMAVRDGAALLAASGGGHLVGLEGDKSAQQLANARERDEQYGGKRSRRAASSPGSGTYGSAPASTATDSPSTPDMDDSWFVPHDARPRKDYPKVTSAQQARAYFAEYTEKHPIWFRLVQLINKLKREMSALISVGKQCPHGSEERHKYVRMVNSMMASYKTIAERWDAAATTLYKEMMAITDRMNEAKANAPHGRSHDMQVVVS